MFVDVWGGQTAQACYCFNALSYAPSQRKGVRHIEIYTGISQLGV